MSARDTTDQAAVARTLVYRRMGSVRRVDLGVRLSEDARAIALEAIRRRHPDYDDTQARFALFRLLLGDALFERVWPAAPRLPA